MSILWYRTAVWVLTLAMLIISAVVYIYYSHEVAFSLFAAFLTAALTAASLIIIGWFVEAILSKK